MKPAVSSVMKALIPIVFAACSVSAFADTSQLRVLELYTSHGCSSCPPAERLFNRLLEEDENLIGLEFHVDYWNQLVHGSSGNFIDPFSNPEYSLRQALYNASNLSGRKGVYTPQAIIDGEFAAVGSDERRIKKQLNREHKSVPVTVLLDEGSLRIEVDDAGDLPVEVWLVNYLESETTEITGGENKSLTVTNHHVVTEVQQVGQLTPGQPSVFNVDYTQETNRGCAVLLQSDKLGPILGAARCQ